MAHKPERKPPKKPAAATVDVDRLVAESDHPLAHARPRGDRVLVRRDLAKKQTEGGILLPDSAQKKMPTGVVVRVGPGRRNEQGTLIPIDDLRPGERVYLTPFAGLEITDPHSARETEEFVMLREEDVIGHV